MTTPEEPITAEDLLNALAEADALQTFLRLPREDQQIFSHWIGKSRDDESHWRRINALVLAMKIAPLRMGPLQAEGTRDTA